jgi:uncharacterized membrane protein/nitrite reductase/ring-hydroxylating ferredoxin subunit
MRSRAQIASHPIHPMLVAFPIALFVISFIFDLLSRITSNATLAAASWYCVIAGLAGGAAAAVPGVIDLFGAVPPTSSARQRGYLHGGLNVLAMALFIAVAAYRGSAAAMPDAVSLALSALGVIMLAISGWLGGTLVYRNQIGVDHRYAGAGKWHERKLANWEQPACNKSELGEGQMMLVEVGGERVVVARCPQGVAAFSDHCTHKGGSLADGALVGCTVQCPWHGSQFDVHNGLVVAGPAKRKIETYEVEVRGGEVYVLPNAGTKSGERKSA